MKTTRIKKEQATRCELAMMGKVVPMRTDEVQVMTQYIVRTLKNEVVAENLVDIVSQIQKYHKNEVKYVVCNRIHGMPCITYLLDSGITDTEDEEFYPAPFEEDYGTGYPCSFCYVFNLDTDWCSEFGDCFFQKKADGYYHRVS